MAALTLLFAGCKEERNIPEQAARLQLNLCIPVEGGSSAMHRIMGDPGKTETFQMPRYLYLIVMKEVNGEWSVWRREERTLDDGDWIPTHYMGGRMNVRDSIYQYDKPINFILNNETPQGRVYAVCSKRKLTFNQTIGSISDMDDLLNWTFETAPDTIQESLQDIYATPYNYTVGGRYYCSYNCSAGNISTVDLILYHVAAKVDINWYVDKEVRINKADPSAAVRLTYMDAQNLFNGNAYCFKPMENVVASPLAAGATKHIIGAGDEGLWWEGRSYFYTIPYTTTEVEERKNYFPLQMLMKTNDSSDEYKPTIYMKIDKTSPFTPWLRANFNLSAPLGAEVTEKVVNYTE